MAKKSLAFLLLLSFLASGSLAFQLGTGTHAITPRSLRAKHVARPRLPVHLCPEPVQPGRAKIPRRGLRLSASSASSSASSSSSSSSTSKNTEGRAGITPVTLLSGFLGTGKTTSLKHLLENKEGLRIGVIVNDVAEVNIDARLIQGYDAVEGSSTIELENGCACCSLSDELFKSVDQLLELGRKKGTPFDEVVIELSGVAEPASVKANFEEARNMGVPSAMTTEVSRVVTVVDTSDFVDLWMTDQKLGERKDIAGDAVDECSAGRSVVELLAEQIEAADHVVLNKIDMATDAQVTTAREVVGGLTQGNAKIVTADHGKVPISFYFDSLAPKDAAVKTGGGHDHSHSHDEGCTDEDCGHESHAHSHDAACEEADCKHESHGHSHGHSHDAACDEPNCTDESHGHSHSHAAADTAETTAKKRFGIENFVYRSRRPFAFERLMAVIKRWPIPRKNFDTYLDTIMDASGDAQGLEAAGIASESPLVRVIRSKGFIWVDTQPRQSLFWSHAGRHFSLDQAGKWWAEASDDVLNRLKESRADDFNRMMRDEWEGEFGDRRQELVFIGAGMDKEAIQAALDKCLLDDEELDEFRRELNEIIEIEARLRFQEGSRVVCRCEKWEPGTVIKVGYRESNWPVEKPDAPYQVQLDSGGLIWVPEDDDAYVRPGPPV